MHGGNRLTHFPIVSPGLPQPPSPAFYQGKQSTCLPWLLTTEPVPLIPARGALPCREPFIPQPLCRWFPITAPYQVIRCWEISSSLSITHC